MTVKFKRLTPTAQLPRYAHDGDSGMDIYADQDGEIPCGGSLTVETGLAAEIPEGFEIQVRPRSGLAAKQGVHAIFGTVDSGYRGHIKVTLFSQLMNYKFKRGERIAQFVIAPTVRADVEEVDEISTETSRGVGGFGSTGK